jgi:hypothetical protein
VKVTEVIHFNHELDLLEAHIVEASHYADRIVIKEGEANWRGEEKPLHATENWDRFRKYSKAEVMVIPADEFFKNPQNKREMCLNENRTRTYGWQDVSDSVDYVIECDVDEIIDRRLAGQLFLLMSTGEYLHLAVKYQNFLWFMNNHLKRHTPYRVFKSGEAEICLNPKNRPRTMTPMIGWHFSGCISGENWGRKYKDMNHIYGFSEAEIGGIDWDVLRAKGKKLDRNRDEVGLDGTFAEIVYLDDYPMFVAHNPELFPWWGNPTFLTR